MSSEPAEFVKKPASTKSSPGSSDDDNNTYVLADEDDQTSLFSLNIQQTYDTSDGVDVIGGPIKKNFSEWNFLEWNSSWAGRIVQNRWFKRLVNSLILINSILMGVATSDWVTENPRRKRLFDGIQMVFLVLFTIEVCIQCVYHRLIGVLHDGWLIFDITTVSLSWFFPPLLVIRTFRIVRTLRLASRVKALKYVVEAILKAVPKLIAVMVLLVVLVYVFAVMFTDMFKDLYRDGVTSEDYFSRMDRTAFTLFQIMTLDEWSTVAKEVIAEYYWAWIPFVSFILISTFTFLNVVIAVLCEAVVRVRQEKDVSTLETLHDAAPSPAQMADDIAFLSRKVDALMDKVNILVHAQMQLQASLEQRQQQVDGTE